MGDILEGVPISERVSVMALASEPRREGVQTDDRASIMLPGPCPPERKREALPGWLDLDVPDDRFIASALEVRREHPKAGIVVVSGDFMVLTKARAARLAAIDAEASLESG
jgi:predicted ribonuclease YlaK